MTTNLMLQRPSSSSTRCSALFPLAALTSVLFFLTIVLGSETAARADEDFSPHSASGIVIHKGRQLLELFRHGRKVRAYKVCLGLDPHGPKRVVGDFKTPEGEYFVCYKNVASRFHRFLGISYPSETDAQAAFERGLIPKDERDSIISAARSGLQPPWNTKLGGWVGIHGYPTDAYLRLWVALFYPKPHNWTDGCIAMWNFEIEDLFSKVAVGTPVQILP